MKFVKVMFSQVSVCPRRGVSVGGSLSWGVCVQGVFVLGRGESLSMGDLCRGVSVGETPPYGNEHPVRILLECILVFI